jgi:hypothetical protein
MRSSWAVASVICAATGALMVAVAAGLVYLDMREMRQAELRLIACGMTKQEARFQIEDDLPDVRLILTALVVGAIGSASVSFAVISTSWRFCSALSEQKRAASGR